MGNRQSPGRPRVTHAAAYDLVYKLPEAPALRHLRAVAFALADAEELGWAGTDQGRKVREYLAGYFTVADFGRPGVAAAVAQALDEHGRCRASADRLAQQGRRLMSLVQRSRQDAAWRRLVGEFGLHTAPRPDVDTVGA